MQSDYVKKIINLNCTFRLFLGTIFFILLALAPQATPIQSSFALGVWSKEMPNFGRRVKYTPRQRCNRFVANFKYDWQQSQESRRKEMVAYKQSATVALLGFVPVTALSMAIGALLTSWSRHLYPAYYAHWDRVFAASNHVTAATFADNMNTMPSIDRFGHMYLPCLSAILLVLIACQFHSQIFAAIARPRALKA